MGKKNKIRLLKNEIAILTLNQKFTDMAKKVEDILKEYNTRLDAATTEIAKDFAELRSAIDETKVSPEVLAKYDANITKLEEMGKDPAQPIPDTTGGTGGTGNTGGTTEPGTGGGTAAGGTTETGTATGGTTNSTGTGGEVVGG